MNDSSGNQEDPEEGQPIVCLECDGEDHEHAPGCPLGVPMCFYCGNYYNEHSMCH